MPLGPRLGLNGCLVLNRFLVKKASFSSFSLFLKTIQVERQNCPEETFTPAFEQKVVGESDEKKSVQDAGTLISLPNLSLDLDIIYRENIDQFRSFVSSREAIASIIADKNRTLDLQAKLLNLVNTTLRLCALHQNAILAVDIFYFIRGVSTFLTERSIDCAFIPWPTICTLCLESILDALSKVNLEILAGVSLHCKLLEVEYLDPMAATYDETTHSNDDFISKCISILLKSKGTGNYTTELEALPSSSIYTSLSTETVSISCSQVIKIIFHIRSFAFHKKIPLLPRFYEHLMKNIYSHGVSPTSAELLLKALQSELMDHTTKLFMQRSTLHYLASLRSTRLLSVLKKPMQEADEIATDIPSMTVIILNLFIRSLSLENYKSTKYDSEKDSTRKLDADFALALKFYNQSIQRAYPDILQFSEEKERFLNYNKEAALIEEYIVSEYDHYQFLQHSVACSLLAHGNYDLAFDILKPFWKSFSMKKVNNLSFVRTAFIEDLFNVCFEFSVDYSTVFQPLISCLGFSSPVPMLSDRLWNSLLNTRPSCILPLFYYFYSISTTHLKNIGSLLSTWKEWISGLFKRYSEANEAVFLPWSYDKDNPCGTYFLKVSKLAYPELSFRDFLWTPILLDLLFPPFYHSIKEIPFVFYPPYYNGLKSISVFPLPMKPFSDLYYGSNYRKAIGKSFKPNQIATNSIALFISKELNTIFSPVKWQSFFSIPSLKFAEIFNETLSLKQQSLLSSFIKILDYHNLSSFLISSTSDLSFDTISKMLLYHSSIVSSSDMCSKALSFFSQSEYAGQINSILDATNERVPLLSADVSYLLVRFFTRTISLMLDHRANSGKNDHNNNSPIAVRTQLSSASILLFMKALAVSNHWYEFFELLKQFTSMIPRNIKSLLWNVKREFTDQALPRSDLFFPKIEFAIDGLPSYIFHSRIFGDLEKVDTIIEALVEALHSSGLFIFNRFLVTSQLLACFENNLNIKTIYSLRYDADWNAIESELLRNLDTSEFQPCSHASDSVTFSKEKIVSTLIIRSLKLFISTTEPLRYLLFLINRCL